jgi:DNA repair exonuclease SbcCD ATPase subunit
MLVSHQGGSLENFAGTIFERFRVRNAKPFKSFDLNLRNRGLVRMKGPNGAGKSSVWHLFTQTGYSETPNKASKTDLMLGEKDFLLEITFLKRGSRYVAAQAVKCKEAAPNGESYNTGLYLFRDGADISKHKDQDTKKLIKQTLGWTLEEWYGYVYLAQQTTHKLINGTRSERQTYLSALFNLTPLDVLAQHYKDKADALKEQVAALEKEKQEYAVKLSMLNGRSLAAFETDMEELSHSITTLNNTLVKMQAEQERFLRFTLLTDQIKTFPADLKPLVELQEFLAALRAQQAEFMAAQQYTQTLQESLGKLVPVAEPVTPADYQDVLNSPDLDLVQAQQSMRDLQKLLVMAPVEAITLPADIENILATPDIDSAAIQRKITLIESRPPAPAVERVSSEQLASIRNKLSTLKGELAVFNAEIKLLEFQGEVCDKCGTPLDSHDRGTKLSDKKTEIENYTVVISTTTKKLRALEAADDLWRTYDALGPDLSAELPELKASLATFQTKQAYRIVKAQHEAWLKYKEAQELITKIPELQTRINLYQKKQSYRTLADQRLQYEKYVSEKANLELTLEKHKNEKSYLADRSVEIFRQDALVKSATQKQAVEEELKTLEGTKDQTKKIESFKAEIADLQAQGGKISQEMKEVIQLNKSIETLGASLKSKENLYREQKKNELLQKAFGKAGQLRELQLSKFSRYLEEALLAHTYRQLPNHRFSIVVDDGIDILTSKDGGTPYDVVLMSGGEKGSLSVAFLFALDDLQPPSKRTNLKIVDEVEANFDAERRQDFVAFTLQELKKRAETVVVISHSDATDLGNFDHIWEIKEGKLLDIAPEAREFSQEGAM